MPAENRDMDDEDLPVAIPVRPRRATWLVRATLLAIGVALAGVFGIALYLDPYNPDGSPRTMATHTKLGMPPCNFVMLTGGKPCPSCGMTTSFALLVRGDVRASLRANWVGTLMAGFGLVLIPWAALSAARGRYWWVRSLERAALVAVGAFAVLLLARWGAVMLM